MQRCPLCRATLNGADTCRRCRAELHTVQRVEREEQALVHAAIHHLSLGDTVTAGRMLRRALALHATPEARALRDLLVASTARSDQRAHRAVPKTIAICRDEGIQTLGIEDNGGNDRSGC